jgi:ADP-heptose:LPS heptosyltransferase
MKVDTMRNVDYYFGVPLCFALTIVKKIFSLFSSNGTGPRSTNILLVEMSEMGSTILADPAMRKLKRVLNANLYFAIFKKNSPSLDLLGTIPKENIYTIDDSGFLPLTSDAFKFLFWTRRNRIDAVVDMELFSRFTALLTGLSGAKKTVGFHAFFNEGLYRGDLLTHKVSYSPHMHISKNFIALANALISDKAEMPYSKTFVSDDEITLPKVTVHEEAKEAILRKIKNVYPDYDKGRHRILLFNANASELLPIRRWPQGNYISLIRMIVERYPKVVILLTGGKSERPGLETITTAVQSDRCVNFAGHTNLSELPALYSLAAFMLSNDSGPPHFASVTEMPTFVFFGPETPKLYGPLGNATPIYAGLACSPCVSAANHRKTACKDNVCLQVITPEQVFYVLKPKLEEIK